MARLWNAHQGTGQSLPRCSHTQQTCYHIQVLVLSQTDNIFSDGWKVWSLADLFCFLYVYIASVSRGSVGCMQRSEDTCSSRFSSSTMWVRPSGLTVSTSPVPSALFSMEFLRVLTRVLEVNGYWQTTQFSIHWIVINLSPLKSSPFVRELKCSTVCFRDKWDLACHLGEWIGMMVEYKLWIFTAWIQMPHLSIILGITLDSSLRLSSTLSLLCH